VKPEVEVPPFNAEQLNIEKVYTVALTTQPDIKSSEYKVSSSEKGLASARGGRYPRIFASGALSTNYSTSSQQIVDYIFNPPTQFISGYTSSGDTVYTFQENVSPVLQKTPFKDQFSNNLGKSIGFTLQVPILNNWSVNSNIRRAKLNVQQSKLNLDQNKKNLYKSVQQAVADAIASYNKYEAGQRSVEALQETYNFNKQRFAEGLGSSFDFLTAKNNYQRAQADLIQAKYDYIFRLKIIDFYLGKPLSF
jgi:outer membrane protein